MMSKINVTPFFKFRQVKIVEQKVSDDLSMVLIKTVPDERYIPVCSECGTKTRSIHSYETRIVRDMNMFRTKVFIEYTYRKIRCHTCSGIKVEKLGFIDLYMRITRRFAQYIVDLCKYMTVADVAYLLEVDRKLVKRLHKEYLQSAFGKEVCSGLRVLAVDEISLKKGHNYLTIVADYETGRIVHVGRERKYKTLKGFFKKIPKRERRRIEAVCMDMWDPYIKAVTIWCPDASIVFDLFHVVQAFGKVINKVRNREYKKAFGENKDVIKGTKYILLKNRKNLKRKESRRLKELLEINKNLSTVYILKDQLKRLWKYRYKGWVIKEDLRGL
ncbi:MAG: ISL3 family transposase [Candidatus Cloacimonadota bacterium]|nr:MAG: ISL3 family transposase [Candidatus Cloacimonadota bacterium]